MGKIDMIAVLSSAFAWMTIGMMAFRIYRKQPVKLKIWKVLLVTLIGLFSFSINWPVNGLVMKISILPLGVWILYFWKGRAKRWKYYRPFAWLGFSANLIFLASTLISVPWHHAVYSTDRLSTYISNSDKAEVIVTHPSAHAGILDRKRLIEQIDTMEQQTIYSEQWYLQQAGDPTKREERFPYQLIGTSPKFGRGLKTLIYAEADGKGLLISTTEEQLYFRARDSFIGERE
ncbi:hypothetical protein [Peribacillus sp. SCS-155]|uniref:hypothetical protein n=1 Tax=Peribacillus sedimenti TaxID=3115297 RepID=UPI0039059D9C